MTKPLTIADSCRELSHMRQESNRRISKFGSWNKRGLLFWVLTKLDLVTDYRTPVDISHSILCNNSKVLGIYF